MSPVWSLVCCGGLVIPTVLYAVLHPLWLRSTTGEANFLYFQCLAYQIFVANLLLQFISGSLQRDKALRVTMKSLDQKAQDENTTVETNVTSIKEDDGTESKDE